MSDATYFCCWGFSWCVVRHLYPQSRCQLHHMRKTTILTGSTGCLIEFATSNHTGSFDRFLVYIHVGTVPCINGNQQLSSFPFCKVHKNHEVVANIIIEVYPRRKTTFVTESTGWLIRPII